jgi:hypothetical protein
MSPVKKVAFIIGMGVGIHVSVATVMYIAHKRLMEERNRKTDATRMAYEGLKGVLMVLQERQKYNDAFWEQVKAEFPEDMMGT